MRYQVQHIKQTFTVVAPALWAGDYSYDSRKAWGNRMSHDPWCWFATSDPDSSPHFTAWATDFKGKGPTATLMRFHITFYYRGQSHKPVHVHYLVNANDQIEYKATDANRAGNEKNGARAYVNSNWRDFDQLAESFLEKAFAIPSGPLGQFADQSKAVIAKASQKAIFDSVTDADL